MRKQIAIEASKIIGRNLLLLGRCISHTVEKDAKVRVKRLIFDDNLNMVSNYNLINSRFYYNWSCSRNTLQLILI